MSQCGTLIHGSREFGPSREITGEPLNSRSRILAPKWREITGVDCTVKPLSRTLGNKILDNSDVVGAPPVSAAPTKSSFLT